MLKVRSWLSLWWAGYCGSLWSCQVFLGLGFSIPPQDAAFFQAGVSLLGRKVHWKGEKKKVVFFCIKKWERRVQFLKCTSLGLWTMNPLIPNLSQECHHDVQLIVRFFSSLKGLSLATGSISSLWEFLPYFPLQGTDTTLTSHKTIKKVFLQDRLACLSTC